MGTLFHNLPNPYTVPRLHGLFIAMQVLAVVCGVAAAAAAVASVTLRWRRADRVRRQQLKWFLAVLPFMALSFIANPDRPGPVEPGSRTDIWHPDTGGHRHRGTAVPAL